MNAVCIYHRVDLDGWMSAAIVKKHFVENDVENILRIEDYNKGLNAFPKNDNFDHLDFLGFQYGDDLPDLSSYDKVIMVDISFPADIMFELYKRLDGDLIWVDHHISAIKDVDVITGSNFLPPVSGLRRTDMAACELAWEYFYPDPQDQMPEMVRLLGRYDCFGHKGTEEESYVLEFQYGARSIISSYKEAYNYLRSNDVIDPCVTVDQIHDKGVLIYQYLCTEAASVWKDAFSITLVEKVKTNRENYEWEGKNRKFACINKNRFNPINFGIDYHANGFDGVACFHYVHGKGYAFSLYNDNGEVDCSVIAKSFGGGGHKGASGFVIDDLNKIFNV